MATGSYLTPAYSRSQRAEVIELYFRTTSSSPYKICIQKLFSKLEKFLKYSEGVLTANEREKMANCINFGHVDIAKLLKASDNEEVTEYEKHTSDGIENESFDIDFDTNNK
ncbi:hypothetical protein TNCV_2115501 [Trichonephila clavipes]|nr:hypothetical protein TNCV_2115501 [Trichonephila clavipes]